MRRTTWERSLKIWELQICCFEEFFGLGNALGLVPASLPHTLGYACIFYTPTSAPPKHWASPIRFDLCTKMCVCVCDFDALRNSFMGRFCHCCSVRVSRPEKGVITKGVFSLEESLEISKFSRISRKWSDCPVFSTVWGLSKISIQNSLLLYFSEETPFPKDLFLSEPEGTCWKDGQ